MTERRTEDLVGQGLSAMDQKLAELEASIERTRNASVGGPEDETARKETPKTNEPQKGHTMTEGIPREIKTPAGTFRLTEEAARREFGPPPEEMERIQALTAQSRREREERENAGKINLDDHRRQQGEKEAAAFRERQRELWLSHGGTEAEFEANWPQIKADYLKEKARAAYANVRSVFD